jgi:hypothetical protein
LDAREIFGPRLDVRTVKRIARRTNLEDDGIQLELLRAIKDGNEFGLLFGSGEPGL